MVVAWKRSSSLVQGRPSGDLWLRVVGTSRADQVVRLSAPKCTIGSASGCTLRLRAAGVRPIECLILRGAHGTVVRACVAGTRLNGQCFSDALLAAGDRLKFGPIELEVLAGDGDDGVHRGHEVQDSAEETIAERSATVTQVMDTRPSRSPEPFDAPTARRQRDQARQARRRAHKLVEQLRKLRGESTWLREQVEQAAVAVAAARDSEHARLQSEQELARLREELQAQQAAELNGRQEAEEELRLAQQMLEQQREAWQARTASHDAELSARQLRHQDELAARHEATLGELERKRADWTKEHQQWTLWKQEEEQRLADLQATLDAERSAVRQDQERLEAVGQDLANDRDNTVAEAALARRQLEVERETLASEQNRLAALLAICEEREADLDLRERSLAERLAMVEGTLAEKQSFDAQLHERSQELDRRAAELTQRVNETEHRAAELAARQTEFAARQTEFLAGRSDFEARFREVDQRQSELAERESHLAQHERELTERQAQFGQHEAGWAERRTQLETREVELAEQHATLLKRAGELDHRESQIAQQTNTLTSEAQSRLSELEAVLQVRQVELEARAAAIARDEQAWQEGRARHEAQHEERQCQLDAQANDLDNRGQTLAAERVELERIRGEHEAQRADRAGALDRAAHDLDLLKQQLENEQASQRERHEQALGALERQSAELTAREQALAAFEQILATREQSLSDREQQLAAAAEAAAQATAETTAETTTEAIAAVDPRIVEELDQRERELAALQSELDRQRDELLVERREGAERVSSQLAELAELRQDLLRERDALREAHIDAATRSDVAPPVAEFADLSDEVDTEQAAAREDERREEPAEPAEKSQAIDLLERCRRELEAADAAEQSTGYEVEQADQDDEPIDDETCEVVEQVEEVEEEEDDEEEIFEAPVTSRRAARSAAPAAGEEEDTVEAYFAAMLNRVRGASPAPAPEPAAPKRNKRKSDRTAAASAPAVDPAAQTVEIPLMASVVDIGPTPTELTRRCSADVKDFSAMRELANAQVKQALDVHGRKRLARTVLGMSSAAVGCLLLTVVLLNFVSHDQAALRTLSYAGFVGAVFWAFSASAAVQQLMAARRAANAGMRNNLDRSQRKEK